MAIKSFSVEDATYKRFSAYCKEQGLSMSKQVEFFMKSVIEDDPQARKEYLDRLERIRAQPSIHIGTVEEFKRRYGR